MKLIFVLVVCLGIWNANGFPTEKEKSPLTAFHQGYQDYQGYPLMYRASPGADFDLCKYITTK